APREYGSVGNLLNPMEDSTTPSDAKASTLVPGLLLAAALVGLGCIAYLNSLEVPFVFDDLNTVQLNNAVLFPIFSLHRPVTYLYPRALLYASFTVNYRFGGEHVLGYHV